MKNLDKGFNAFEKKDYTTALAEWVLLSKQGIRWAKNNVAVMYFSGWGVEPNRDIAKRLFDELGIQKLPSGVAFTIMEIQDPREK